MTTDKARKRAVRTRMQKTGERYAAARRHVVAAAEPAPEPATATPSAPPLPPRVAEPTLSEDAVRKGTGQGWDDWFRILDAWDATTKGHPAIARYLVEEHGVPGWWAQGVTVGYEWARGLRAHHEAAGGYQVSVSKTIAASAEEVWRDFVEPARRNRWLASGTLRTRPNTGTRGKSARFDAADGRPVTIWLEAKGERSSVSVTCERLADGDDVEAMRAVWRAHLAQLAERWSSPTVARVDARAS
jgi:hypothetical protein